MWGWIFFKIRQCDTVLCQSQCCRGLDKLTNGKLGNGKLANGKLGIGKLANG